MSYRRLSLILALALFCIDWPARAAEPGCRILLPASASPVETLAAREIRRYVYLRTQQLLPILSADAPNAGPRIIVARKDRALIAAADPALRRAVDALKPQQYLLRTIDNGSAILVVGGDDSATLYGAYRLAEVFGVSFELDGDVLPDQQVAFRLPAVDETASPLFELRGIQPFHDFPEGPDWWDLDHYKTVISQLPKLRMNFFGLHTYPEGGVGPEPAVWIGRAEDIADDGAVRHSYPSSWMNTRRGTWGYAPKKTGDYIFGAAELFEHDAFGPQVMLGHAPLPATPEAANDVFARAGALLNGAFTHARALGVKTCVGTETPLLVPKAVRQRINPPGGKLTAANIQSLYEGIFQRIARTYPLDYYWFWTPEDWTWRGVSDEKVQETLQDLQIAIAAAKKVNAPFALATCGWVLGPQKDRALFDKVLPKEMPLSCINRAVGKEPVERGFANVQGRGKWAIPWMEDDPNLTYPQLWVGRMRKDAADALKYGCNGLLGIHWRTRIIAPNVQALAKAAWDQQGFSPPEQTPSTSSLPNVRPEGAVGGQFAAFPNKKIAGTDDPVVYQSVRYNVEAYNLALPNGAYTLTLQFCEPAYKESGRRVFGVRVQGKDLIDQLDIFAKVGPDKALDYTFKDIPVTNGLLAIEFVPQVEFPSIAGIVVQGPATRKINCGGPRHNDYAADFPPSPANQTALKKRYLATGDFYLDWARSQFGPEAAPAIAKVFERIDGHLPEPSGWTNGPGGLKPDPRPWENAAKLYAFIDELAALRSQIKGSGNVHRFDYWLANFRYMRSTERVKAVWAKYNDAIKQVGLEKDAKAKAALAEQIALPLRKELVQAVHEVYNDLLATVRTPGELGTVCNWEQHILPGLLTKPGQELAQILGKDLPSDAQPTRAYAGPLRLIVPTVRTSLSAGEKLDLKVIILAASKPQAAACFYRKLGQGDFAQLPLTPVARGVYRVSLPAQDASTDAIEYYLEATDAQGAKTRFPASAPTLNQTLVITP